MKNTCPFALIGWLAIWCCYPVFTGSVRAEQQKFQPRLSLMKDEEFNAWLIGTEWEFERDGKKQSYWFISPNATLWTKEQGGNQIRSYGYQVPVKGKIEWYKSPVRKKDHQQMRISEHLDVAILVTKDGEVQMARINRRFPPRPPQTTTAQFTEWLQSQKMRGGNGHTLMVEPDGWLVAKWPGWKKSMRRQLSHIQPGLVQFPMVSSGWDQRVFLFSPDLQSYILYTSKDTFSGKVSVSLPKEKGTLVTENRAVSIKDAPEVALKAKGAFIQGLLVVSLGSSRYAGKTSKLAVSALKLETSQAASLSFNQDVGADMEAALREVARFHALRHEGWPRGYRIELAFADKYSSKDGPSAAVACALLLESLVSGIVLSDDFAVTGDLNADGTVQPVGGVTAKLRAANKSELKVVAIPEGNRDSAVDLAISEGMEPFLGTQMISISSFDEALALARHDRNSMVKVAISNFEILSAELRANPGALGSPATLQTLMNIARVAPNHVSAKVLLALAQNRLPDRLSAAGSLEAVDATVAGVLEAAGSDLSATSQLDAGQLSAAKTKLHRLRTLVDGRVQPYVDAWLTWAALADQIIVRRSAPPHVVTQIKEAAQRIQSEGDRLSKDVEFNEELMQ